MQGIIRRSVCGGRRMAVAALSASVMHHSSGQFDHPSQHYRRQHTFNTLPMHDANRFGGRAAYLREIGPINHRKRGRLFKRDPATLQYNVDVWCAQQSLRKQWKGRHWDVVEMPFELAPRELQRVIPEKYTDVPVMADPARKDYMNIRRKVYDRESLQDALYTGSGQPPYPPLQRIDKATMSLDKFL
ncbi:hypothetical protein ABL78_3995 [Leptomonas seymouri]|uniref:Uncharacterized protein n=1 Tax=Leptomonas seymouri TaxID=5684 RepID=A0A0N0P5W9_LEPSE|nr:hypothetical protein ABL78_3995 [Leptomonas seymouri]|eukprot:KPI86949.1 hypothetical protein ABL78_3995 [Leptomonas seymouri]